MKKHSLYLRPDQIAFLQSLNNASDFVREALDQFIAKSDRTKAEKTIVLYEAIRELEAKITAQTLLIESNGKETERIAEETKKAYQFLKLAQDVSDGKFEVQEISGKWRAIVPTTENKHTIVTSGHATQEEAKSQAIEKGKTGIRNAENDLKELEQKKACHELYLQAQKRKLEDMQENLKALYARMK